MHMVLQDCLPNGAAVATTSNSMMDIAEDHDVLDILDALPHFASKSYVPSYAHCNCKPFYRLYCRCQVPLCSSDLGTEKRYFQRHRLLLLPQFGLTLAESRHIAGCVHFTSSTMLTLTKPASNDFVNSARGSEHLSSLAPRDEAASHVYSGTAGGARYC